MVEESGEASYQFGQIGSRSNIKWNWSDGGDRKLVSGALSLSNNDCRLGSTYAENHTGMFSEMKLWAKQAVFVWRQHGPHLRIPMSKTFVLESGPHQPI